MQGVLAKSLDRPMEVDDGPDAPPSTQSTGIGKSASGPSASSKSLANPPLRRSKDLEYEGSDPEIETDASERHSLQSSPAAGLGVTLGTSSQAFKSPPSFSRRQTEKVMPQDSGPSDLGLRSVAPVAMDPPSVASTQAATAADAAAKAVIATAMRGLLRDRQTTSEAGQPAPKRVQAGTEEARVLLAGQIASRSNQSSSTTNKSTSRTGEKGRNLLSGGACLPDPAAKTPLQVQPGPEGLHNPYAQFLLPEAVRPQFMEFVRAREQAKAQAKAQAKQSRSTKRPVSDLTVTAPQPARQVHLAQSRVQAPWHFLAFWGATPPQARR